MLPIAAVVYKGEEALYGPSSFNADVLRYEMTVTNKITGVPLNLPGLDFDGNTGVLSGLVSTPVAQAEVKLSAIYPSDTAGALVPVTLSSSFTLIVQGPPPAAPTVPTIAQGEVLP